MLTRNMNFVFFSLTILILGLNPLLGRNALSQEKTKILAINERDENDHEEKNHHNKLFSDAASFRSTLLFPKSTMQYKKVPQQKTGKIFGELLFGSIGSFGFGYIGAVIGASLTTQEGWFSGWIEAALGYLIGSTLGSSIGVYMIGVSGDETGSFGTTLGGSILGTGIGIGLLYMTAENNAEMGFISFTLAQSAGATIAYNASARKRYISRPDEAVFHFKEGKWNFSYPKLYLRTHPLQPDQLIETVNLVSLEF